MIYPVVAELAADGIAVAVTCRVLGVSTSGFYEWRSRPPSARSLADHALGETIRAIHLMSRGSYGAPCGCTPSCAWPPGSDVAANGWNG